MTGNIYQSVRFVIIILMEINGYYLYFFGELSHYIILRKYYDELEGKWWLPVIWKRYAKTLYSTNCLKAH